MVLVKMEVGSSMKNGACLDTVRALHQTVVSLRAALEQSRSEIIELKTKAWPLESVENVIKSLSIENHILRQKIIDKECDNNLIEPNDKGTKYDSNERKVLNIVNQEREDTENVQPEVDGVNKTLTKSETRSVLKKKSPTAAGLYSSSCSIQWEQSNSPKFAKDDSSITISTKSLSPRKISQSLENITLKSHIQEEQSDKKLTISKTVSFSNICEEIPKKKYYYFSKIMSFDLNNIKSNDENSDEAINYDTNLAITPEKSDMQTSDLEQDQEVDEVELIFTTDDTKEQDFKEALVSIDENAETKRLLQCPTSDFELSRESNLSCDLEDDVFNDNFENDNQINQSNDCSKNTLQLYNSKSDNSINQEEKSFKSYYSYQDSSFENKSLEKDESFDRFEEKIRIVETDISKVGIQDVEYTSGRRNTCPNPLQYRPISHRDALSRGVSSRKTRPILAHSNAIRRESGAQTDISALPSSSWRSESSLAHKVKVGENFTTLPSKFPLPGSKLRLSDKTVEARRVLLSDIGFTSMVPELSRSADHICPPNLKPPGHATFGQFLRTPDLYSPGFASQRFTWTTTGSPSEGSHTHSRYSSIYPLSSPLAQSRRCSAPVSPSRRSNMKYTPSKVKFANGSLPELRTEWTTVDSGDSTDSLVDEAENYLRRSIECITDKDYTQVRETKGVARRASAPEAARDNIPPQGWQPFLPRLPRDLRLDYWVKVITSEGRVRGGRVRYVGPLATQSEQFVGVQLSTPDGICDGTFNSRRYFQCEAYHGIFVPFKKVVMGWRP